MFKNKTVLITGAAVGMGRACALNFANDGANVILVDYNAETLAETEKEIKNITENVLSFVCDISDSGRVSEVVIESIKRFNKIDILVNNAALVRYWGSFVETDIEVWKNFLNVNVIGTVNVTKAVINNMINNNYGRIINVASVAGVYGNANMAPYSASKGAVISFTKALAKEVAQYNITVNAISPGTVSNSDNNDIDFVEYVHADFCYCGRSGSSRENADLICFLASDKAGYISGQNIQIDGCRKKI